jgi:hypothetical protein
MGAFLLPAIQATPQTLCRSRLASEGLKSAAFRQQTSVIVNDLRCGATIRQAGSYRGFTLRQAARSSPGLRSK